MLVKILPMGNVPQKVIDELTSEFKAVFGAKSTILPRVNVPISSFNQWKKQFNGEAILNEIARSGAGKFIEKSIPTVIVTDVDIFAGALNFAFGVEAPDLGCCLISISRLRTEFYGQSPSMGALKDRTVKEAIHALGHYFGLKHCKYKSCVMAASSVVEDIDAREKKFCGGCKYDLEIRGVKVE